VRTESGLAGLVIIAALAFGAAALRAQEPEVTTPPAQQLIVADVFAGIGRAAAPGMQLIVHYTGWLYDAAAPGGRGRQFDSSRGRGQPFAFVLGEGRVIAGWEQGCTGMQVGGRRRLIIPPELAYGESGVGDGLIPPGATLLFEIELLAVGVQSTAPQTE